MQKRRSEKRRDAGTKGRVNCLPPAQDGDKSPDGVNPISYSFFFSFSFSFSALALVCTASFSPNLLRAILQKDASA